MAKKPVRKRKRKRKRKIFWKNDTDALKRRKLREDAAPGRGVTSVDRICVFRFFGRACLKCGATKYLVLDHVRALYMGGHHDPRNLQVLCRRCNLRKGLQTIDYRPRPYPG